MNELSTAMTQTQIDASAIALSPKFSRLENWIANWQMGHRDELPKIDRGTLCGWKVSLDALLAPATDDEVAVCVERLRANYPEFEELDETVIEMIVADLLDDLAAFPKAFLVEACRRWRNSPATRAPTAGQLKAMVAKEYKQAVWQGHMVSTALKAYEQLQ